MSDTIHIENVIPKKSIIKEKYVNNLTWISKVSLLILGIIVGCFSLVLF